MSASLRSRYILIGILAITFIVLSALPWLLGWGFVQEINPFRLPYSDDQFLYPPAAYLMNFIANSLTHISPRYQLWFAMEVNFFLFLSLILIVRFSPGRTVDLIARVMVVVVGFVMLSSVGPLPEFEQIYGFLPWIHYDMAPAALLLAACFAKLNNRRGLWAALLGFSAAMKLFAFGALPAFLKKEKKPVATLTLVFLPTFLSLGFIVFVDSISSAFALQSERGLHAETTGAGILYALYMFQEGVFSVKYLFGTWELIGPLTVEVETISFILVVVSVVLLNIYLLKHKVDLLIFVTTVVTAIVVFAPSLSPQLLLWILPLSAAAFSFGKENIVLLLAVFLTNAILVFYNDLAQTTSFGMFLVSMRSLALLVYFALLCLALFRTSSVQKAQE